MAANASIIEEAIGPVDGANAFFATSGTYVPGTVFIFYNGDIQTKDCVIELGGTSFQTDFIPLVDDIIQVRYLSVV